MSIPARDARGAHAKSYRNCRAELDRLHQETIAAFSEFKADVDTGAYPASEHTVPIADSEFKGFVAKLESEQG